MGRGRSRSRLGALLAGAVAAAWACEPPPRPVAAQPGEPLPGLSEEQRERFAAGRALFDRDFTAAEGLGPLYNQMRCSSCHDVPVLGGGGTERIRKATGFADARCDLLQAEGGDNLQQRVTPALAGLGLGPEAVPRGATHVVDLAAAPLFGLGLVEAISDETLEALSDPDDEDGDGISGRVGRSADGRSGRFGHKADVPTLREFVAGALLQEMGLTTSLRPAELTLNGMPVPPEADPRPEPEVSDSLVDLLVDYVRFLAPPAPAATEGAADSATVVRGAAAFDAVGCTGCHVPLLTTGADDDPAFSRRTIAAYSDFLLHDLGSGHAGVCAPGASPTEVRTPPLAGLRLRPALGHDGQGGRLGRVIEAHGGEASASRDRFTRLPPREREALLRFLRTL